MDTVVPPSASAICAVTVADALPWPRVSRPEAFSTTRCRASSFSANDAVPRYWAVIGPTLIFTWPW